LTILDEVVSFRKSGKHLSVFTESSVAVNARVIPRNTLRIGINVQVGRLASFYVRRTSFHRNRQVSVDERLGHLCLPTATRISAAQIFLFIIRLEEKGVCVLNLSCTALDQLFGDIAMGSGKAGQTHVLMLH